MDRALASGAKGPAFESRRARHFLTPRREDPGRNILSLPNFPFRRPGVFRAFLCRARDSRGPQRMHDTSPAGSPSPSHASKSAAAQWPLSAESQGKLTKFTTTSRGHTVSFDNTKYRDLDYGYAATIHKTQGTTVDRSFVLATRHFDKHTTYVSMSRHRDDVTLCYSGDNFKDFKELQDLCGRERPKHLIADFAMPRGLDSESQATAWSRQGSASIPATTPATSRCDGKKYTVLEDFETKKQHLVPFKEEYGQLKMFRAMQYDGQTLQYAPDKSKSPHKNLCRFLARNYSREREVAHRIREFQAPDYPCPEGHLQQSNSALSYLSPNREIIGYPILKSEKLSAAGRKIIKNHFGSRTIQGFQHWLKRGCYH